MISPTKPPVVPFPGLLTEDQVLTLRAAETLVKAKHMELESLGVDLDANAALMFRQTPAFLKGMSIGLGPKD